MIGLISNSNAFFFLMLTWYRMTRPEVAEIFLRPLVIATANAQSVEQRERKREKERGSYIFHSKPAFQLSSPGA